MKYYFVNIECSLGMHEYSTKMVFAVKGKQTFEKWFDRYMRKEFYENFEAMHNGIYYYDFDNYTASLYKMAEITKAEYDILNQYI